MTDNRATAWSLTINNPTPSDEEGIALARQRGWKVEGQLEKGKDGTPHYQLLVKTPQVRFSAVKKAFPRAHIEVCRNVVALQQYVKKEDTRQSTLPTTQEKYPSLSRYWELISQWLNDKYPYIMCGDSPLTLEHLDKATYALIYQGYHVEGIATNPSTRSAWKLYGEAIMMRAQHKETARQTDVRSDDEQSIVVPEYNNGTILGQSSATGSQGIGSVDQDHSQSAGASDEGHTEGTDTCFGEEDD